MGDPSDLRFVPSSCATIPIDWSKVPEASKQYLLECWGTRYPSDSDSESSSSIKTPTLPATIEDLAKRFHETRFFGYITPEVCALLLDISELGLVEPHLTKTTGLPVGPRFYMKYLNQIWFVLFVPGSRDGITGYSPEMPYTDDWYEDEGIARDKALAEDYDAKLCEEVSRMGALGAVASNKVAGWKASTLESDMEFAQMANEIMQLPANPRGRMMHRYLWPW